MSPLAMLGSIVVSLTIAATWSAAPAIASWLVRRRASRLPDPVAQRLLEEWLAEVAHIESRGGKLTFALRLQATRAQSLVEAMSASDAIDGVGRAALLSIDDVVVAPTQGSRNVAGAIDLTLLAALFWLSSRVVGDTLMAWLAVACVVSAVWSGLLLSAIAVWSATPGQLLAGLRVVPTDGGRLSWPHIRSLARDAARQLTALYVTALLTVVVVVGPSRFASITIAEASQPFDNPRWRIVFMLLQLLQVLAAIFRAQRGVDDDSPWLRASQTKVVYRVPRVVGIVDTTPRGPTSAMR